MKTSWIVITATVAGSFGFLVGQKNKTPEPVRPELYQSKLIAVNQPDMHGTWKAHVRMKDGQLVSIDVGDGVVSAISRGIPAD